MILSNQIKYILLPVFILSFLFGDAQNYRLLNPDRTITFTKRDTSEADSAYFFMKIDSFSVAGTDTTFYFNRLLDTIGDGSCEIINGDTTLLGYKAIARDDVNGTYVFFNKLGDSIFIRTKLDIEEEWHIYDFPDGSGRYVKGYALNQLNGGILPGMFDSIYRIKLNVYNNLGVIQWGIFPNETIIDFSKNYGIVQFWPFYDFPNDKAALLLRGVTDPYTNIVDVDARQAFDFQLGNEFHYREEVVPDNGSGADKRISAWKYYVMGINATPTSVTYQMEYVQFDTLYFGATPSSTITWDTIDITYNYADYGFLDTIELNVFQADHFGYSDFVKNDSIYKGLAHKYVYDWFEYNEATNCMSNPDNISQPEQLYGDGLGLMHYTDSTDAENYYLFDMVYFQKGLLLWGTPYDFSGLDVAIRNKTLEPLNVYPNPASTFIHFTVPDATYQITVYSIDGKELSKQEISSANNCASIDITELEKGIYIAKISSGQNVYSSTFSKI